LLEHLLLLQVAGGRQLFDAFGLTTAPREARLLQLGLLLHWDLASR
jgi:hypothetical protein